LPDQLKKFLSPNRSAALGYEDLEDVVLGPRKWNYAAAARHCPMLGVYFDIPDLDGSSLHNPVTPYERPHTSEELSKVERLGEVIVGATFEAGDAVFDQVTRGHHEDRSLLAISPEGTADVPTGYARQH
jgi:hypothetical protein